MPRPRRISPFSQLHRSISKAVVSLAQQFDVLDIRRGFGGGQRRLRVSLGEAVAAEHLRVKLAPELGVVPFPAAQVLDDQRFVSDARLQPVESPGFRTFAPQSTSSHCLPRAVSPRSRTDASSR